MGGTSYRSRPLITYSNHGINTRKPPDLPKDDEKKQKQKKPLGIVAAAREKTLSKFSADTAYQSYLNEAYLFYIPVIFVHLMLFIIADCGLISQFRSLAEMPAWRRAPCICGLSATYIFAGAWGKQIFTIRVNNGIIFMFVLPINRQKWGSISYSGHALFMANYWAYEILGDWRVFSSWLLAQVLMCGLVICIVYSSFDSQQKEKKASQMVDFSWMKRRVQMLYVKHLPQIREMTRIGLYYLGFVLVWAGSKLSWSLSQLDLLYKCWNHVKEISSGEEEMVYSEVTEVEVCDHSASGLF